MMFISFLRWLPGVACLTRRVLESFPAAVMFGK
jgi:hypothetical protein